MHTHVERAETKDRAVRTSDGVTTLPSSAGEAGSSTEGMVASRRTSCRRRHSSSTYTASATAIHTWPPHPELSTAVQALQ